MSGEDKVSRLHRRILARSLGVVAVARRMRPDSLGEVWSNVRGIRGGDGAVPVGRVSPGALGPGGSYSWQRRRGAVLHDMLRSRIQRDLRDIAWAIHTPDEHTIRRQCQDTLADIPAVHAGSWMVRAEPKCPSRCAPGARRRLDEGFRYWREGRGERTVRHSAGQYRRWSQLVTRLPEWPEGTISRSRDYAFSCGAPRIVDLGHPAWSWDIRPTSKAM